MLNQGSYSESWSDCNTTTIGDQACALVKYFLNITDNAQSLILNKGSNQSHTTLSRPFNLYFKRLLISTEFHYLLFFPFSLQNTSGQTAADLAYARGFHNCFHLISTSQLRALPVNEVQNGDGASCGLDLRSRKRLLTPVDSENSKRVRRAGGKMGCLTGNTTGENKVQCWWCMFVLSLCFRCIFPDGVHWSWGAREHEHRDGTGASSRWDWNLSKHVKLQMFHRQLLNCLPLFWSGDTKAPTNSHHPSMPYSELPTSSSPPSEAPMEPSLSNTCGSLHLAESPSSCASHRPVWWGITGADYEAFLHYGHYHGFGDTAEDLSDCSQLEVLHRYEQAVHL